MGCYFLVSVAPPSLEFLAAYNKDGSGDPDPNVTHTYSSVGLGTARGDRRIILTVGYVSSGLLSGVTINGQSATKCVEAENGGHSEIWIASVPSGTSGSVVLTFSDDTNYSAIAVYSAKGLVSATPADTDTDDVGTTNLSLDIAARGILVATAYANSGGSSGSATWTGAAEDYDLMLPGGFGSERRHSGSSYTATAAETGRAIQCSGMSGNICGCGATFR